MVEKTVTISKDKIYKWIAISVSILLCALCVYLFFTRSSGKLNGIEGNDSTKTYKTYYDQSLKDLKKVNEALYDSIKKYSNVESAMEIKYHKTFVVDTTYTGKKANIDEEIKTYTYSNKNKNDSLNYELTVASSKEPNWYKMKIKVGDDFTIINRKNGDLNQTIVDTKTNADINVTPFHSKTTKSFWKRFTVGPQVGVYYGAFHKNIDVGVGIGVSFDILNH